MEPMSGWWLLVLLYGLGSYAWGVFIGRHVERNKR